MGDKKRRLWREREIESCEEKERHRERLWREIEGCEERDTHRDTHTDREREREWVRERRKVN